MKFSETEVDHILAALEFGIDHTPLQIDLDRFTNIKGKINARRNRKIPVTHYHWFTETEHTYILEDGLVDKMTWTHPTAVAPCGYLAYENKQHEEPGWPAATLTKVMADVTCKKCRKWLHLDPKVERHIIPKVDRNISLDL